MFLDADDYKQTETTFFIDEYHHVKFSEDGIIKKGIVYFGRYDGLASDSPYTGVDREDIESFWKREYFILYSTTANNILVSAEKETVNGTNCSTYILRRETSYYDSKGTYRGKLPAMTKVGISTNKTGATYNHLISIQGVKVAGEWKSLYDSSWNLESKAIFIDYKSIYM